MPGTYFLEIHLPIYVKGVGGLKKQNHIVRPSGYHDYQWLHCISGKRKLHIDGKEYVITKNSGFLMYPHVPHEYYAIGENWETHWVTFEGKGADSLLHNLGFNKYNVFYLDDIRILNSLVYDIFIASQAKRPLTGHKCSAKLYTLLIELKFLVKEKEEMADNSGLKKLQPVLDYIESNYQNNPSIEDMSSVIGVSPQYLCRIFRAFGFGARHDS